uniref:Homeobox domain-containing protein n=1 Tax=Kwoniella bestiolae CBS 10118 TaxID=1296100 RepID=A0A1B9G5B1_9TREE|nr:hypothetical protein I302_03885 [Kwoniella bestiolae CBS 10118]OCF26206.1 hypothetical protein I302_03885 [Kwoniella bestiolae CBS 10118]
MSVPLPQGYANPSHEFVDQSQPQAGPSNYARPPSQPQAPPHLQGPPPQTPYYGVNGHIPPGYPTPIDQISHAQQNPQQQQFMAPYPPNMMQHGQPMIYPGMEGGAVVPNFHFGSVPQNAPWMDEWADGGMSHEGQDMVYSNLEVKHRRRTTPDQLKILEYWYDINPKPDNALREHLAAQLGMTKRNVQVWFQNRRAKMKGLAKKDDKGDGEDQQKTPEKPTTIVSPVRQPAPRQMLLPPMGPPPMARRASLANGEAAKIEMFVAKRAAAAASGQNRGLRPPGFVSPQRSPLMGQASAARRQSIPYPTPITAGPTGGPGPSPKISPVVRVMPSALHLTAMRNNTRRASMPGAAQLISSGPFTPPRVVTNQHQVGLPRELGTIKDDDPTHSNMLINGQGQVIYDQDNTDFTNTYMTPPSSSYGQPSSISPMSFLPTDSSSGYDPSIPFSPNSPLPNPAFSFGTEGHSHHQQLAILNEAEAARQQQLFLAFQQRGRMGSIASIGTYTTDNGGTDLEDAGLGDWINQETANGPDGFDPDARRASAPADLLHQIGIMGLNNVPAPIRPSPLGSHFTPDNYHTEHTSYDLQQSSSGIGISSADLDPSPISMSSIPSSSSESVSPTEGNPQFQFNHIPPPHQPVRSISLQQFPTQHQHQHSSSVSPYSEHSIPPGSVSQNANYATIQSHQMYQNQYPHTQNGVGTSPTNPTHQQNNGVGQETKDDFSFLENLNNGDSVDILA